MYPKPAVGTPALLRSRGASGLPELGLIGNVRLKMLKNNDARLILSGYN
jgi:hypothetical protein